MTQQRVSLPPGPERLPVVGNVIQFRRDPLKFVRGVQRSYGAMATVHLARFPVVMFFRPEHVRYFLTENARNFTNREFAGNLRTLLGDGLLTTDGEFHRQQRRLVQPAFHKRRVEGYAQTMVQHTLDLLDEWQPGTEVDIARAMQALTLRIVAKALFNVDLKAEGAELGQAFSDVIENPVRMPFSLRSLPLDLPFMPYHKHLAARQHLDEYVYGLIRERRTSDRDYGDVLSMLLHARDEDGSMLTDKQVRDETMTLLAAGHETTANALAWTFYLLSEHPAQARQLQAELRDVLGGRPPEVDDLPRLRYLDQVVNESMRIFPPAWTQGRRAIEPFELDGYTFPAGQVCMFSQWVLHHLPEIWGDPETFRPERWDPVHGQKVPQGAYFPFGGGPRMCIGMPFAQIETRLLLATILQRYALRLVPGWPVVPRPRVTLRPKYGIRMRLERTNRPHEQRFDIARHPHAAGADLTPSPSPTERGELPWPNASGRRRVSASSPSPPQWGPTRERREAREARPSRAEQRDCARSAAQPRGAARLRERPTGLKGASSAARAARSGRTPEAAERSEGGGGGSARHDKSHRHPERTPGASMAMAMARFFTPISRYHGLGC